MNKGIPDTFMVDQWAFMIEVINKRGRLHQYTLPLLYLIVGKLEGYGLAHPEPGKMTQAFRMAKRVMNVADYLENHNASPNL